MDFSKVKNLDKINVSKSTNQVVYSALLKLEREKRKLKKNIEKLQEDTCNEKEKSKSSKNSLKEL